MSLNPFEEQRAPSPGERYQAMAAEAAEAARLVGLNLSPGGVNALAVLLGEAEEWWLHSDGARVVRFAIRMLPKISHALTAIGAKQED
jgi:hypothetical protein